MRRKSLYERLEEKYIPEPMSGCWLWEGHVSKDGYGRISATGYNNGVMTAHRASYLVNYGIKDNNNEIHHKCRNKICIRPEHLEEVTKSKNLEIKAHDRNCCPQGHPFEGENVRITKEGARRCRECHRKQTLKHYYKKKKEKECL